MKLEEIHEKLIFLTRSPYVITKLLKYRMVRELVTDLVSDIGRRLAQNKYSQILYARWGNLSLSFPLLEIKYLILLVENQKWLLLFWWLTYVVGFRCYYSRLCSCNIMHKEL